MSRFYALARYTEIKLQSPPNRVAGTYDHKDDISTLVPTWPLCQLDSTPSTLKYAELNWDKWPTIHPTFNFFMNKSGINFNKKKGWNSPEKNILLPEREACSTSFFEGRVVGVKLTHDDGPRSVASDLWAMPRRRAVSMSDSLPKPHWTCNLCIKMEYRRVSATDGNSVANGS